jgi:competence protein ComGC
MQRRGLTLVEVLVIITVIAVAVVLLFSVPWGHPRTPAGRAHCASNLKQISTAMYEYSTDYNGQFPSIPLGSGIIVGEDKADKNLKPGRRDNPFKDFPTDANHSISQNLWLLIRQDFAQPEIFTCPSTPQAGQKVNQRDPNAAPEPGNFVDFPWANKENTISYSFVQPWSQFTSKHNSANVWHADTDPQVVMGGDANNGSQPDFKCQTTQPSEQISQYVNSTNHKSKSDGQNCIFGDGHVTFERSPYVGIDGDNIYTALPADYTGRPSDTPGDLSVRPRDQFDTKINKPLQWDTVLIPNRDADLEKWNCKP